MPVSSRANGFTIIELIMVIVVLGALSVFVVPSLSSKSNFDVLSFEQELKTAIRYAHKLSIASECAVQVSLTANSYTLFYPNAACIPPVFGGNPVSHPVESGAYSGTAPSGVTMAGLGSFFFTSNGSPSISGTITVNPGGKQIIVNPLTGFVQ